MAGAALPPRTLASIGDATGVGVGAEAGPRAAPGTRTAAAGGSEGPSAASREWPDGGAAAGAPVRDRVKETHRWGVVKR